MLTTEIFAERILRDLTNRFQKEPVINVAQIREISFRFIEPLLELLDLNLEDLKDKHKILHDLLLLLCEKFPPESENLNIGSGEEVQADAFLKEKVTAIFNKHCSEMAFLELERISKIIYSLLYKLLHEYRFNKDPNRPDIDVVNIVEYLSGRPLTPKNLPLSKKIISEVNTKEPPSNEIEFVVFVLFSLRIERLNVVENTESLALTSVNNPLFLACKYGFVDLAESLISHKKADPNLKVAGYHMVSVACFRRDFKLLEVLLQNGAKADVVVEDDDHQTTPLHIVCSLGHDKMARSLLLKGGDLRKTTSEGCTPLMLACDKGHEAVVALLLLQPSVKSTLDVPANDGATPFIRAFTKGYLPIARALLQAGAEGMSWLYRGCNSGNVSLVNFLIADPKIRQSINSTTNEMSPLKIACLYGHVDVARSLLAAGADLGPIADDILMANCLKGSVAMMQFLLTQPATLSMINTPLKNKFTLMTFACASDRIDLIPLLINKGASVSQADKNGYTPLQWAHENKNSETIKLIEAQLLKDKNKALGSESSESLTFAFQQSQTAPKVDFDQLSSEAMNAFKAQKFQEAVVLFEQCLAEIRKPSNGFKYLKNLPTVLYNLGSTQLKLGTYDAAKEAVGRLTEAVAACGADVKEKYGNRLKEAEQKVSVLKPEINNFALV